MLSSWREFDHCKVPIVKARVEEIVRRVRGPRVLEVGCNEGWVAKAVMEERGFECVAVDNRLEARIASEQCFGIEVINADANKLPFADSEFDTVIMGELLEHMPNPGVALAEGIRVSKGHIIITIPIGAYWLGEPTHLWELNGAVVEHDQGIVSPYNKHVFIIEWDLRRRITTDGRIEPV